MIICYAFLQLFHIDLISLIGFLPQNTEEYHNAIKQIAYFDEWKHHRGNDDDFDADFIDDLVMI